MKNLSLPLQEIRVAWRLERRQGVSLSEAQIDEMLMTAQGEITELQDLVAKQAEAIGKMSSRVVLVGPSETK